MERLLMYQSIHQEMNKNDEDAVYEKQPKSMNHSIRKERNKLHLKNMIIMRF